MVACYISCFCLTLLALSQIDASRIIELQPADVSKDPSTDANLEDLTTATEPYPVIGSDGSVTICLGGFPLYSTGEIAECTPDPGDIKPSGPSVIAPASARSQEAISSPEKFVLPALKIESLLHAIEGTMEDFLAQHPSSSALQELSEEMVNQGEESGQTFEDTSRHMHGIPQLNDRSKIAEAQRPRP